MRKYKLTEEIARWAFEIKCEESKNWFIAFTNPTAGPWKTIKCKDSSGQVGEVYRFGSKENRPDIIIINDAMHIIIIVEAKDALGALVAGTQAQKSVEVVANLSSTLKDLKTSKYWANRYEYDIYTSVLWGSESATVKSSVNSVFDIYHAEVKKYDCLDHRSIIGIESRKKSDASMECRIIYKTYEDMAAETRKTLTAETPASYEVTGAGKAKLDSQIKSIADTLGLPCEKY